MVLIRGTIGAEDARIDSRVDMLEICPNYQLQNLHLEMSKKWELTNK